MESKENFFLNLEEKAEKDKEKSKKKERKDVTMKEKCVCCYFPLQASKDEKYMCCRCNQRYQESLKNFTPGSNKKFMEKGVVNPEDVEEEAKENSTDRIMFEKAPSTGINFKDWLWVLLPLLLFFSIFSYLFFFGHFN